MFDSKNILYKFIPEILAFLILFLKFFITPSVCKLFSSPLYLFI